MAAAVFTRYPIEKRHFTITGGFRQTEGYGYEHGGVDLGTAGRVGIPVYAPGDSLVDGIYDAREGYQFGTWVRLSHGGSCYSAYAHLMAVAHDLAVGDWIRAGRQIGFVGMTGLTNGPHLHWAYGMNPFFPRLFGPGQLLDPLEYLKENAMNLTERMDRLERLVVGNGISVEAWDDGAGNGNLHDLRLCGVPSPIIGEKYVLTGERALMYSERRGFSFGLGLSFARDDIGALQRDIAALKASD